MKSSRLIIGFLTGIMLLSEFISAQQVKRIVSLAPSLTKNIYFLESQHLLVGCTNYCLQGVADKKEIVASAVTVNIEKVVSLKPDLIVTTDLTNPETIKMFRKFNIRVEVFPTARSFDEICDQTLRLGQLIDYEKKAKEVVGKCRERVKKLISQRKYYQSPSVFFQIGAKPLFAVIPNTFMNDYITLAGGKNVVSGINSGIINRETVVASDPDVIFIVTMGIVCSEEKKVWQSYREMSAAKNKKIFIIDSDLACTPTPVTFVRTLEEVIKLMNQK